MERYVTLAECFIAIRKSYAIMIPRNNIGVDNVFVTLLQVVADIVYAFKAKTL